MDQPQDQSEMEILTEGLGVATEENETEQLQDTSDSGVEGKDTNPPEDSIQTDEEESENNQEETQAKEETTELFTELIVGDEKLPFKSKEEFEEFIEKNQLLKEGYMRLADYTRKNQALAKDRDELEQAKTSVPQDDFWKEGLPTNGQPPTPESLQTLRSIWHAFQSGDQNVTQGLQSLANYVAQNTAHVPQQTADPKYAQLEKEVSGLKQTIEQQQQAAAQREWNDWKSQKESTGQKLDEDLLSAMNHAYKSFTNLRGEPFSFDESYEWALHSLGRTKQAVAKEVLTRSKEKSKSTPRPPASHSASIKEPEPDDEFGLMQQALRQT